MQMLESSKREHLIDFANFSFIREELSGGVMQTFPRSSDLWLKDFVTKDRKLLTETVS